jgi:isopentenyl-diphosphate delta-isomerase
MTEDIILVNEQDERIGLGEKLAVHEKGLLHRAFSVLVYNSKGELLIQQRAQTKYHWPGIWANSCCSHPKPDEKTSDAAHRRLQEELGFDCPVEEQFSFHYTATYNNGLIENEIDHVFYGTYDGEVKPNPEEVQDYAWVAPETVLEDVRANPQKYCPWFIIILEKISDNKQYS